VNHRTISFRCSDELYRTLLRIAHEKMLSVSDVVRQAILMYIEKETKGGQ
jgi:Ribbon-helix-helix protein, copG family.